MRFGEFVSAIGNQIEFFADGQRIEIRGFGSFVVKDYESYWGRNPKTGEKIFVAPKKLPAFKVGKELRERLNGGVAGDDDE
mgnify:CR=1 FL=1